MSTTVCQTRRKKIQGSELIRALVLEIVMGEVSNCGNLMFPQGLTEGEDTLKIFTYFSKFNENNSHYKFTALSEQEQVL